MDVRARNQVRRGLVCWRTAQVTTSVVFFALAASAYAGQSSVWSGIYTEQQAKRGQALYRTECARCHAESLAGAESGPPLVGDMFREAWNEKSVAELLEKTQTTMPYDSPGRLSGRQYADLVAYMLQVNQFPAGDAEMSPDAAALRSILILRPEPAE